MFWPLQVELTIGLCRALYLPALMAFGLARIEPNPEKPAVKPEPIPRPKLRVVK